MPRAKLTADKVNALKPGGGPFARAGIDTPDRDFFLWDDKLAGFGVKVTPTGAKVYLLQYRLNGRAGKTKRYTIGRDGSPWRAGSARIEAERLLTEVKRGVDVCEQLRAGKVMAREMGFAAYVDRFAERYLKQRWSASWEEAKRLLERHALPAIGDKPLPSIVRADVKRALDRVHDKPGVHRLLHATLRRLFNWAVGEGDLDASPMGGIPAPAPPESRKRVLDNDELGLAWRASFTLGKPFGPIVRLLILTGQRRDEVAALDWAELKRSDAMWHLPKERAKNGEASDIHLAAAAIAELDDLAGGDRWPRRGLVFSTTGKTAPSGFSRAKRRLDAAMLDLARADALEAGESVVDLAIKPWRLHDLRRTMATGQQRLGTRFEVTEAILNHLSGARAGVAGVYQRHKWEKEKAAALDEWAAFVGRLVNGPANVVSLAERRA